VIRTGSKTYRAIAVVCLIITAAVALAATIGVFMRGSGATELVMTPRGETFRMVSDGIYQYNSERLVAEGVGWDIVTLFVAVPVMLLTLPFVAGGSLRGRLLAVGMLGYFFYQYLMYALAWAFGPLFLLYVAIYAASLVSAGWIISTVDVAGLPQRFSGRFPGRGIGIFSVVMAVLLLGMWVRLVLSALSEGIEGVLHGQNTLVVQALDLGIIVPLAVVSGITAWRRRPIGYLLAPVFLVKGATMAAAICAMVISAWTVEGAPQFPPLLLFGLATVAAVWLGVRTLRSLDSGPRQRSPAAVSN
jgi:hypothetical protein